ATRAIFPPAMATSITLLILFFGSITCPPLRSRSYVGCAASGNARVIRIRNVRFIVYLKRRYHLTVCKGAWRRLKPAPRIPSQSSGGQESIHGAVVDANSKQAI